jgi:exosome complex exonuclease RRP6
MLNGTSRRPLPKEMLHYARSDTHYLLSIYDRLRLALHEKATSANSVGDGETAVSPLEEVYRRSIGVSSITFSLPPFDHETGHFDSGFLLPLAKHGVLKAYATALAIPTLPLKTGWGPSEGRFEVLRSVIRWREQTARDEDESGRYVLSLQGSLQLAEVGAAGGIKDANDVMRVLGGTRGGVSEVARRRKDELAAVITETVERVRGNGGVGSAGGDDDVVLDGGAAASAITSAQLGFPAPEPAVRPIDGLWEAAEPVASTSRSATTVVNVSVAAASAFFGGGGTPGGEGAGNGRSLAAPVVPVAASSSFFGPAKSITAVAAKNKKGKSKARAADAGSESSTATRTEAVKRVHDSLVLGGGLGQVRSEPALS